MIIIHSSDHHDISAKAANQDIRIMRASEFHDNADEMTTRGYDIYQDVFNALPKPFPVILLPRSRDSFHAEETLLAIDTTNDNQVIGIALLEKITDIADNTLRFGQAALEFVQNNFTGEPDAPIYELGAIAVCRNTRKKGIGAAFYHNAYELSQGRCIAVVTQDNIAGHKTALKADFIQIPDAVFHAPFTVEDGYAKPHKSGHHRVTAHLYALPSKHTSL